MAKFPINNIRNIDVESSNALSVHFDEDESTLIIRSNINTTIIDSNFNELDKRLSNIEAQLKLRFQGEINVLRTKIEKLENERNS